MARHGWLAGHAGKDPNAGLAHFKTHHIHHVLMAVINVMFPVPPTECCKLKKWESFRSFNKCCALFPSVHLPLITSEH